MRDFCDVLARVIQSTPLVDYDHTRDRLISIQRACAYVAPECRWARHGDRVTEIIQWLPENHPAVKIWRGDE